MFASSCPVSLNLVRPQRPADLLRASFSETGRGAVLLPLRAGAAPFTEKIRAVTVEHLPSCVAAAAAGTDGAAQTAAICEQRAFRRHGLTPLPLRGNGEVLAF
jgi:hypothetical protein